MIDRVLQEAKEHERRMVQGEQMDIDEEETGALGEKKDDELISSSSDDREGSRSETSDDEGGVEKDELESVAGTGEKRKWMEDDGEEMDIEPKVSRKISISNYVDLCFLVRLLREVATANALLCHWDDPGEVHEVPRTQEVLLGNSKASSVVATGSKEVEGERTKEGGY